MKVELKIEVEIDPTQNPSEITVQLLAIRKAVDGLRKVLDPQEN